MYRNQINNTDKTETLQKSNDANYLAQMVGALSYALDLAEGQKPGHCIRFCWIRLNIGEEYGLSDDDLWNLYYTLLLKDAGCSSNASRVYEIFGMMI